MRTSPSDAGELDTRTRAFYHNVLGKLGEGGVPFLVGGAYALHRFTGIVRHTKDFDIFVRPRDVESTLQVLAAAGYRSERTYPHWLGKVYCGEAFIDVIFSSGNAIAEVDDGWFEHAVADEILGRAVQLAPPEEMIWSKAYLMERERYDGADIAHLLRACAPRLDWDRLLRRFGPHWRILLSHLILFGFTYPAEQDSIPRRVLDELLQRLSAELADPPTNGRLCQGTLLSRAQYLIDIERWGYRDARLLPEGKMTPQAIAQWTAAI
jgi:hypothetical protein